MLHQTIHLQVDGGANRSITNMKDIFTAFWDIDPYKISGIAGNIICTGKGLFPLMCTDGSSLLVEMHYSADASCTVISPTDVVVKNDKYDSWWQVSYVSNGFGHLRFYSSSSINNCIVPLVMRNHLWFVEQDGARSSYRASVQNKTSAFVAAVQGSTLHHLWHHRLGHPGTTISNNVHKVCNGVISI